MSDSSATGDNLGQSTAIDITGKIMVVIIIILFCVVVTFLFFHLFAKGFWWSHNSQTDNNSLSRRRRRGQQGGVLGEGGLDPLLLESLPVSVFNSEKDGLDLECSVCLSELVEGEKVRVLPKCNHRFHIDCIDMWFQSHSTCPLCRTTLVAPEPSSEQSSTSAAFPTNVLIWGNHDQTISSTTSEQNTCSSSSSSSSEGRRDDGMLRIDIPNDSDYEATNSSSSPSPSSTGGRLRSLKRLLSNSRLNPWSPTASNAATTSAQQQTKPKELAAQQHS